MKTIYLAISLVFISTNTIAYEETNYPLCDVFLDITWVNDEFTFGFTKLKPLFDKGRHASYWNFFAISPSGFMTYELDDFFSKYGEKKAKEILNHSTFNVDAGYKFLTISNGSVSEEIWSTHTIGFRKKESNNLCIYLPSKKMAWIFKAKKSKDSMSTEDINLYLEKMLSSGIAPYRLYDIENSTYTDLNSDGILDFFTPNALSRVIYSEGSSYKQTLRNVCNSPEHKPHYTLYDGINIYISTASSNCNLNEITSNDQNQWGQCH